MEIKRKYIIDERNRAVAVQLDIKTFEKIEETLENYESSKNLNRSYTCVRSALSRVTAFVSQTR